MNPIALPVRVVACILQCYCLIAAFHDASAQLNGSVKIVWRRPTNEHADLCTMSAGGQWALTADRLISDGMNIRVRKVENGEIQSDIHFGNPQGRNAITTAFGKDSTTIQVLTAGNEQGSTGEIYIFNTLSRVIVDSVALPKTDGRITCALQYPDGVRWILGDWYGLFVFNIETKQTDTIYTNPEGVDSNGNYRGPTWIGISDDQLVIYTIGQSSKKSNSLYLLSAWDVATRKRVYKDVGPCAPINNPPNRLTTAWSEANRSGDAWNLYLYELSTGSKVRRVPGTIPTTSSFSLSEDGRVLGYQMNGNGKPIRFVDTETGAVMGEFATTNSYTPIIQFLTGTRDVFLLAQGMYSIRLRIIPATDVPVAKPQNALQCTVQPNPSDGSAVISVVVTTPTTVSIRLVAADGKVVQETAIGLLNEGAHSVPVRAPAGHYVCMIFDGRETTSIPVIIR